MDRGESEGVQTGPVLGRGVALVAGQVVARIQEVHLLHQAVARHLGDDRGRGHRSAQTIGRNEDALVDLELRQ